MSTDAPAPASSSLSDAIRIVVYAALAACLFDLARWIITITGRYGGFGGGWQLRFTGAGTPITAAIIVLVCATALVIALHADGDRAELDAAVKLAAAIASVCAAIALLTIWAHLSIHLSLRQSDPFISTGSDVSARERLYGSVNALTTFACTLPALWLAWSRRRARSRSDDGFDNIDDINRNDM